LADCFKSALQTAGLSTEWGVHDLRRAAANALHQATGDLMLANQLLRHSDICTTRGYQDLERLAEGMWQTENQLVRSKHAD
jgi:site-specific recombinase XerD